MAAVRNVLFIMCDQLRADHLSCYGHPHLHTPHIDRIAQHGVKFERAFVQSGVCEVRLELKEALFDWLSQRKIRTTIADQEVALRTNRHQQHGVFFGVW